ncbi:MAG: 5-oxoprolinase subunit PxpB [Allorhizobium sp.]
MDSQRKAPRLSMEGTGAILLDAADATFDEDCQTRIWAVSAHLRHAHGVCEVVPGMNNMMVVFDPLTVDPARLEAQIRHAWDTVVADAVTGRTVEIAVIYGGEGGADLNEVAAAKAISVDELVARHTAPLYSVAAVGAMPGFVYLSGLDPSLALARRSVPRMVVPVGSVIIGGAQAGIMPLTAPSGWHILGHTDFPLFDTGRAPPAAFRPGDRIRFVPQEIRR